MGIIDSVMDGDAAAFFDADLMPGAETITYKPKAGSTRSISAQVNREGIQGIGDGINAAQMTVSVRNHSTYGISAAEIDASADKISVAYRRGGTAQDYPIGQIIGSDGQVIEFTVQGRGS